ncbi:MAG: hypothetical protein OEL77_02930 [Nitrosopumilus sp.]|nr:hypothetical protein [Nitrosopumilus sp.]MDH3384949.1 hypothetical protein [Nitrosopumilus sp.]
MNNVNLLFIISIIFVPLMLISINYSAISDFYEYSVPLNSFDFEKLPYTDDPTRFQKTLNMDDSTCYTTLSMKLFCYEKPRIYEESGVSYVRTSDGIEGELHFDPVENGVTYFTIQNMTRIQGDTARITLADRDYSVQYGEDAVVYSIDENFEYSAILEKFDTFISHCHNYEGTEAELVQYLGVSSIDNVEYFMTWHTIISSDKGVSCDYPEIIKASLNHDFRI